MEINSLIEGKVIPSALHIQSKAYAPFSQVKVGAVVVALNDGGIIEQFPACNFEISATIREHAEKNAARLAYMSGYRHIHSVYVTSQSKEENNAMCPECRDYFRKIDKFMNIKIVVINPDGSVKLRTTLKEVLPFWSEV